MERLPVYDNLMRSFLVEHGAPGAALAVAREGHLVHAAGYGWADGRQSEPVTAGSLFRIASLTKPFTATAVLQLVEQGRLWLDQPVCRLLRLEPIDPLWLRVTVRQLLNHTAGFDRSQSFDPMGEPVAIAEYLGIRPPPMPDQIVWRMLAQPLDFAPGSHYAYSNFGYCLLGRVVEKVTGERFESYLRRHVLAPLGIDRVRVGRSLASGRAPGEVAYHTHRDGGRLVPAVMGVIGEPVPWCYGGLCLEAMDSSGGLIASAADLVRFASAFDVPELCPLLGPDAVHMMFARPPDAAGYEHDGTPKAAFYACGWLVRPYTDGRADHWHTGMLEGSSTLLFRRHDGLTWAVLFNTDYAPNGQLLANLIDPLLHEAADAHELSHT